MPRSRGSMANEERILERLDQVVRILGLQVAADKSITERARLLKVAGLDNQTISEILNTSSAVIRTLTSNLRLRLGTRRRITIRSGRRAR
jgi:DNA-binding CsgD family transcriptional regulator